jgi:hypothetical protein
VKRSEYSIIVAVVLVSLSSAKDPDARKMNLTGWISDSECAARVGDLSNGECAKRCVEHGEKLVLVLDQGHRILVVDNPNAVEGHEGQHVRITGKVAKENVHVDKLSVLKVSNK